MSSINCEKLNAGLGLLRESRTKIGELCEPLLNLKSDDSQNSLSLVEKLAVAREVLFRVKIKKQEFAQLLFESRLAVLLVKGIEKEKYRPGKLYLEIMGMLEKKKASGVDFAAEDLRFLYNVDEDNRWLLGQEYKDRVDNLLAERKLFSDYALIYGVEPEEVILAISELDEHTKVYIGKRDYNGFNSPKSSYDVAEDVTEDELARLAGVVNLPVDLTKVPKAMKKRILAWEGSIIDLSDSFDYPNIKRVGRDIYSKAQITLAAGSLEFLGGNIYSEARRISLPKLKYAHEIRGWQAESLDISSLREAMYVSGGKAREAVAPELEVVNDFYAAEAESLIAPKLRQAWNTIAANNAKKVDLRSLAFANDIHLSRKNQSGLALNLSPEMKKSITWMD